MDPLLQACGAAGELQLTVEYLGNSRVECRRFATPYVVIGRRAGSDLVLDHKEVCDRHAFLQRLGRRLYCVDLGSRSGITLGGHCRRAGWVEPGEAIRIGPYRIRLLTDESDRDAEWLDNATSPGLILDLSHRGYKAAECQVAGGLSLVGSATGCQVRLLDPSVSNVHCSLLSTHHGTWAIDLRGKGGIELNGVPVRHVPLQPGDELRVGRSTLRVRQYLPAADVEPTEETSWSEEPTLPVAVAEAIAFPPRFETSGREELPPGVGNATATPWDYDERGPAETEGSVSTLEPSPRSRRRRTVDDEALAAISARERRTSCRYPVAHADAVLSWWEPCSDSAVPFPAPREGVKPNSPAMDSPMYLRVLTRWPGGGTGTPAPRPPEEPSRNPPTPSAESLRACSCHVRLQDISQTGLLVQSERVPPAQERIWIRLELSKFTEWVEVALKGASPTESGQHQLRLAFLETCPYDFFKAVVYQKPGS